jgi:hypothetical protein
MFLAMEEHGEDEDLCGLSRQSVIYYVHGRISVLLYYCVLNLPEHSNVCRDLL